jgi:hypothetical protein
MAGSKTWREYTSDHGTIYSIQIDKSNAKLIAGFTGEALCNVRGSTWELPPKSLILRRIHCFSQYNQSVKRSFVVGNPKVLNNSKLRIGEEYLSDLVPTPGALDVPVWLISGYTGEKFTNPPYHSQLDTGLDDGSAFNQ